MKSKLLKLLNDYSVKGRLVDKNYIEKLIDLTVLDKELANYVCGLIITGKDSKIIDPSSVFAAYYPNQKLIKIYMEAIDALCDSYSVYQKMFTDDEQVFYKNLLITQIVLHELEHANQRKIIDQETSLEEELLRVSSIQIDRGFIEKLILAGLSRRQIDLIIERYKAVRDENYLILPDERLADIKSNQDVAGALSEKDGDVSNLIDFVETNILENKLRGYTYGSGKIVSPTIDYITRTGKGLALQKFYWFDYDPRICLTKVKSALSLDDRLTYGLPIDKYEFISSSQTLLSSRKYNI